MGLLDIYPLELFALEILAHRRDHGLWTPNEGINQRNLNVADKICFGGIYKFGIWI